MRKCLAGMDHRLEADYHCRSAGESQAPARFRFPDWFRLSAPHRSNSFWPAGEQTIQRHGLFGLRSNCPPLDHRH